MRDLERWTGKFYSLAPGTPERDTLIDLDLPETRVTEQSKVPLRKPITDFEYKQMRLKELFIPLPGEDPYKSLRAEASKPMRATLNPKNLSCVLRFFNYVKNRFY